MPAIGRRELPTIEMVGASLLLFGSSALTVVLSTGARESLVSDGTGSLPPGDLSTFVTILTRNIAAALGLFTGVVTFGLGTVIMLLLVGAMLGLSMATSVDVLGLAETVARSWAYTPIEIAGFVVAAAAGLMPVVGTLRGSRNVPYLERLPHALYWFGVALVLILVGAVVETAAIWVGHLETS